jgi:DNA-binding CsgD family transcriptional regulator
MRQCLDWSLGLLTDDEARIFRRLSIFAGRWTAEAAEQVCGDEALTPSAVFETIVALANKSLIEISDEDGEQRFRMLVPVRQYAAALLAASPEFAAVGERHRVYFTRQAISADRELSALNPDAIRTLDADAPDLRAALDAACRHSSVDALRIAASLALYWKVRGRLLEGTAALARALDATRGSESWERARALAAYGWLLFWRGCLAEAVSATNDAVDLARALDDLRSEARALVTSATAAMMMNPQGAQPRLKSAIGIAEMSGDDVTLSEGWSALAMSYHWQHDFPSMMEAAEAADAVASRIGLDSVLFWMLWGRVHEARVRANLVRAAQLADQFFALTINEDVLLRHAATEAVALVNVMNGRAAHARKLAADELRNCDQDGDRWGTGAVRHALARADLALGEIDAARVIATRLYDDERDGSGYLAWQAQEVLMHAALSCGDAETARQHGRIVRHIAQQLGNQRAHHAAGRGFAEAALLDGDIPKAEAEAHAALAASVEHQWWADAIAALDVLVESAARRGRLDRAVRLHGGVRRARHERSMARYVPLAATRRAALEKALPAAGIRSAEAELGQQMTLLQVAEYAARGRGKRPHATSAKQPNPRLTPMERRVAELAARGLSNKMIAKELFVAPNTVKNHLARIFEKLDVPNRTALAAKLSSLRP